MAAKASVLQVRCLAVLGAVGSGRCAETFLRDRCGNRVWDQNPGKAGEAAGADPEGSLTEMQVPQSSATSTGSCGAIVTCQSGLRWDEMPGSAFPCSAQPAAWAVLEEGQGLGRGGSLRLVPTLKEQTAGGHLLTPLPRPGSGSSSDRASGSRISLSAPDPKACSSASGPPFTLSHCRGLRLGESSGRGQTECQPMSSIFQATGLRPRERSCLSSAPTVSEW